MTTFLELKDLRELSDQLREGSPEAINTILSEIERLKNRIVQLETGFEMANQKLDSETYLHPKNI